MKIQILKAGGKSPPVAIPIELWCRICDAVGRSPDSTPESIAEAAEQLAARKTQLAKKLSSFYLDPKTEE